MFKPIATAATAVTGASLLFVSAWAGPAGPAAPHPARQRGATIQVIQAAKHDTSPPWRSLAKSPPLKKLAEAGSPIVWREIQGQNLTPAQIKAAKEKMEKAGLLNEEGERHGTIDKPVAMEPLRKRQVQPHAIPQVPRQNLQRLAPAAPAPVPLLSFLGTTNTEGVFPPDTDGAVGMNYYFHIVNSHFVIFDKQGNQVMGPLPTNTLWSGFGGNCEFNNAGDGVVFYDQLAQRWVVTQFGTLGTTPADQCVAVSVTSDPTGAYYRYDFPISGTDFNDYPKIGLWNGGYFYTANAFGAVSFDGVFVGGFERDKMLQGQPAQEVVMELSTAVYPELYSMLPADADGLLPPPANTPALFINSNDPAYGAPNYDIEIWGLNVDWSNPAAAAFTQLASLPADPFLDFTEVGSCSDNCVPQPDTSQGLDEIADRPMYSLNYRNYGDHESIVFAHTVNAGTASAPQAGVRWYEIRNPSTAPTLYQQGTFAPADGVYRWMGSAALDASGDIAIGYSAGNSSTYPSIRYTGRTPADPLGTMESEQSLVVGTGSQTGSDFYGRGRWGDYSSMSVDPLDQCTFWYTQEYVETTGGAPWETRIGSFKFPNCSTGPSGMISGTVTSNGAPVAEAQVKAGAAATTTGADGTYSFTLPVGTYDMTVTRYGFGSASMDGVGVTEDGTTTENFTLTAEPPATVQGTVTDGSGHGWPLYAKVTLHSDAAGGAVATVYTDPFTGAYSVTSNVFTGETYSATVAAVLRGYTTDMESFTIPASGAQTFDAALPVTQACNAAGYAFTGVASDFEDGVPPDGWSIVNADGVAHNVAWKTSTEWADDNYTNGTGIAATADSDRAGSGSGNYDTSLLTPEIPLANLSANSVLKYTANFKDYVSESFFDLDYRIDDGAWTNVLHWAEDHGGFRAKPGEDVNVPLSDLIAAGGTNIQFRWRFYDLTGSWDYYAQVDNVQLGTCQPVNGGLVEGITTEGATGNGLSGVKVADGSGHSTVSLATPDDPALSDGLYVLFTPPGSPTITASKVHYADATAVVNVANDATVRQDFAMQSGFITVDPGSMSIDIAAGGQVSKTLTVRNTGGGAATFRLADFNGTFTAPTITGPFAESMNLAPSAHSRAQMTGRDNRQLPAPYAPSSAARSSLSSIHLGLTFPYGLAVDRSSGNLWIGNPGAGGGDDMDYEFTTAGTPTGRTVDVAPAIENFAADMAFNDVTGTVWQIASPPLTTDPTCIFEFDPETAQLTGNTVCPKGFAAADTGLAFDPTTNTFYAGGFNDDTIYHFDTQGNLIDSKNVSLPIQALAFNSSTGHLFVVTSAAFPTLDVYVLDARNGYSVLLAYEVDGLTDYNQGASLDYDCDGHLWATNFTTGDLVEFDSGETGWCDFANVTWMSENPTSGSLEPGDAVRVTVTATAGSFQAGDSPEATLEVVSNTPHPLLAVPVTMHVLAASAFADVSVSGNVRGKVQVGKAFTYNLTVDNAGPADATAVMLTDTLPVDVSFVSASVGHGAGTCTVSGGTVTCDLGALSGGGHHGGSADVSITVIPNAEGKLVNALQVNAGTPDANTANNSATITTEVGGGGHSHSRNSH